MTSAVARILIPGLAIVALVVAATSSARACQVCLPYPKDSFADHVIAGTDLVLAREDPERPFHFRTIEVLKGAAPTRPLDLFLDSASRRILKAHSDRSVLLAGDGKGKWRRLALMDDVLRPVVVDILELAPKWKTGGTARYDYFAKLLGHDHPVLHDLAHLEVARAPYAYLRDLGRGFPRGKIVAAMSDLRYLEWFALNILLLAQSEDERDRKRIIDSLHAAERLQLPLHLGAWATAYIEIEGDKAIEFLESRYLRVPRQPDELREVTAALSVQGNGGRAELRDRIVAAYGVLLEKHPGMAPDIVGDLLTWRRWEMADAVSRAADRCAKDLKPDALGKLRWFVAMAARASR